MQPLTLLSDPTVEPQETLSQTKIVTPLKIQKIANDRYAASKVFGDERDEEEKDVDMDHLNPSREIDYKDCAPKGQEKLLS